tara:strand:- start:112 stop:438 length:327 start_codon:yes stop_codon:yes gene_type:complete
MADNEVKTDSAEVETPVNHVNNMVNSLVDGDNVAAQDAFKNALTDKIGQALDDKRMTVAKDWLSAGDELEATQDASGLDNVGQEEPVEIEDPSEAETEAENDTEVQEV